MKNHSKVHSGERPHKCETCKQGFARLDTLRHHMLIHSGEKPYSCDVCNMPFRHRADVKRHISLKH